MQGVNTGYLRPCKDKWMDCWWVTRTQTTCARIFMQHLVRSCHLKLVHHAAASRLSEQLVQNCNFSGGGRTHQTRSLHHGGVLGTGVLRLAPHLSKQTQFPLHSFFFFEQLRASLEHFQAVLGHLIVYAFDRLVGPLGYEQLGQLRVPVVVREMEGGPACASVRG